MAGTEETYLKFIMPTRNAVWHPANLLTQSVIRLTHKRSRAADFDLMTDSRCPRHRLRSIYGDDALSRSSPTGAPAGCKGSSAEVFKGREHSVTRKPSALPILLAMLLPTGSQSLQSTASDEEPAAPAEFVLGGTADRAPVGSAAERRIRMAERAMQRYPYRFDLSGLPRYEPKHTVSGVIRLWGNNYIGDSGLAERWCTTFRKHHPAAQCELVLPTAAVAAPSLYFGLADLAMNHELTFYDYLSHVRILGYEPTGFSIVTGSFDVPGWQNSIAIVVHKDNPLSEISMEQLDGVFGSARAGGWIGARWEPEFARGPEQNIRTWGQLGLTGEWADKPIHTYGYSLRYATALEFSNKVLSSSDKWNENLLAYGNYVAEDGSRMGQADSIVGHLEEDRQGIAYLRWRPDFEGRVKVLRISETSGAAYFEFSVENIQARRYPLWGDQSLWVSVRPGTRINPKPAEFIRFVLSREGQQLVMEDGKYFPLPADAVAEQLARLAGLE